MRRLGSSNEGLMYGLGSGDVLMGRWRVELPAPAAAPHGVVDLGDPLSPPR